LLTDLLYKLFLLAIFCTNLQLSYKITIMCLLLHLSELQNAVYTFLYKSCIYKLTFYIVRLYSHSQELCNFLYSHFAVCFIVYLVHYCH